MKMNNRTFWLISWIFLLCFFVTDKAQAQLIPCAPSCEDPTGICAMDPTGVSTNISANNGSTGCTEETPIVQCQLTGTSWCTGNMLDGWSILSGPTTSQSVTESGKLFRFLDGTLTESSSSNCLNPGDAQSSFSSTASCSVTVTPNDPDSTLPDKTLESNDNYSSENDLYWMPDYGLEAVVDCSHVNGSNEVVPQVKLFWNNIPYPGFELGSLVISRKESTEYYYEYLNILMDWDYDGSMSSFIDDSTDWDHLDNNKVYDYYIYSYLADFDGNPYNYDYNYESNVVRVPVECPDPDPTPPLSNGFNISSTKSGDSVTLQWNDQGNDVVQYYIVKDSRIINDDNPSTYNWWGLVKGNPDNFPVATAESTFVKYVTDQNSFTDPNAVLASGEVAKYRVYACKLLPLGLGVGYYDYRFEHYDGGWDYSWYFNYPQEFDQNLYTWNTRYPWDHELVLSEEVIVHADGTVEETNTDPIDEGGSDVVPCLGTCSVDSDCDSGLSCIVNQCRNAACPAESTCACSDDPSNFSSLTDVLSNSIVNKTANHTLLYDIRIDGVVTDGSLKIDIPTNFVMGTLNSSDITTTGGDVTWGSATINDHTIVIPFTGELSKNDDRITIDIGNTNFITNPSNNGNYNVSLSSHNSADGSGSNVDLVSDRVLIRSANDEGVSSLSDTLSSSKPSADSRHTLRYDISQSANTITDGSLKVTLANEFNLAGLTDNDITIMGGDVTWNSDKIITSAGTQIGWLPNWLKAYAQGENSIVFNFTGTLDSTDNSITIIIGDTNYINNPSTTGPFTINLTTYSSTNASGNPVENLTAMVHINDGVTVTANVPPSLTFTVTGVNMGVNVNGAVTNIESTSDNINFGVFTGADDKVGAQDLTVSTNATNGFVVTIQKENDFASSGSDTIADFTGTNDSPTTWASPNGTQSYFGYTTDDYTLSQTETNRFNSNKWAKVDTTPYEVMYHTDPINGVTQGQGTTRIGYQMEITNLQPAGIYQTKIMYICTATF